LFPDPRETRFPNPLILKPLIDLRAINARWAFSHRDEHQRLIASRRRRLA
jgi:hypothetical protein